MLFFLAPGLVLFLVVGLWQGRAAYELAADQRAWRDGEPLEVTSVETHVTIVAAVSRHVRITATFAGDGGEHWVVRDDYWTLFTDSVGDGPLEARHEPSTGRVALSWSMQAALWRWAWILFFGLVLGALGAVLCRVAWRALRALRTAQAAARGGEEIELEVLEVVARDEGAPHASLDITYRLPPVLRQEPSGYRVAATHASSQHTRRFEVRDRPPVLLDGDTRLLAIRPDPRRSDVTVLQRHFWPFLLERADRERAAARLEERAERGV